MGSLRPLTNFYGITNVKLTLSPVAVNANTTVEQTFSIPNVAVGDVVLAVNKPSAQSGLGIVGYRVSSAGNIGITFANNTGSPITPTASEMYLVVIGQTHGNAESGYVPAN